MIHTILLLSTLAFGQSTTTANSVDRIRLDRLERQLIDLRIGRPDVVAQPKYINGIKFSDGSVQVSSPSVFGISTDTLTAQLTISNSLIYTTPDGRDIRLTTLKDAVDVSSACYGVMTYDSGASIAPVAQFRSTDSVSAAQGGYMAVTAGKLVNGVIDPATACVVDEAGTCAVIVGGPAQVVASGSENPGTWAKLSTTRCRPTQGTTPDGISGGRYLTTPTNGLNAWVDMGR